MAEYIAMITSSSLLVTLYLGGYAVPAFIAGPLELAEGSWQLVLAQLLSFGIKLAFFLWLFVWVRWSLPRFRFDQLMRLGWKALIPIGFFGVILAAVWVIFAPKFWIV